MARPQKSGIDYFPLDTDMEQDDKIALIEAKYGILGFGLIIKLFKKIYGSNGYYYDWNEETQLLFSKQIGLEFAKINEIVEDAIKWDLFDSNLWKIYKVLTSKRIQRTYLEATGRRKEVEIIREYMINGINDYKNKENVNVYSINVNNKPDIKGKERKGKERKEGNGINVNINLVIADIINYLNLKTGKNFRTDSKIAVKNIIARLNEKYTLENFKKVIDIKCSHWLNPKKGEADMSIYLSPDTLFGNKFEKYLNQNANKEAIQEAVQKEKDWDKIKEKRDEPIKHRSKETKLECDKVLAKFDPKYRDKLKKLESEDK